MSSNTGAILTLEEAEWLLLDFLTRSGSIAGMSTHNDDSLEGYLHCSSGQRRGRDIKAKAILLYLYGDDMAPDKLEVIIAANQWAITTYGLLSLFDLSPYRIAFQEVFDRHLLDHIVSKGSFDREEFLCCLLYARTYAKNGRLDNSL